MVLKHSCYFQNRPSILGMNFALQHHGGKAGYATVPACYTMGHNKLLASLPSILQTRRYPSGDYTNVTQSFKETLQNCPPRFHHIFARTKTPSAWTTYRTNWPMALQQCADTKKHFRQFLKLFAPWMFFLIQKSLGFCFYNWQIAANSHKFLWGPFV